MLKKLIAGALALGLVGCATAESESVPGPSGKTIHQAKCSGSSTVCLKKANQTCKGPYQVLDSSSNAGGLVADIMPGPVTWYRMSFQCGPSDGRMPTFAFRGQEYRAPAVVVTQPRMTTTSCNRFGNRVSCTSY